MTSPNGSERPLLVGLDRSAATYLAAEIARRGLLHLMPWDSPDHGWTDPLNDPETKAEVRKFIGGLFREAMAVRDDAGEV